LPMSKQQLSPLTGLRFLAAMHVVFFHARQNFTDWPAIYQNVIATGNIAVSLFFILSGFVLAYNYIQLGDGSNTGKREFWTARFARIYPLYFLGLLLFTPAVALGKALIRPGQVIATLISTLLLFQAWNGLYYWNQPGWSLSDEGFFYLLFPLLAVPVSRLTKRHLVGAMFFFWILDLLWPLLYSFGVIHSRDFVLYNPLVRLPEFCLGMCLGTLYIRTQRRIPGMTLAASALLILLLSLSPSLPSVALHNGLLAPVFAFLIWGLATERGVLGTCLGTPLMVLLGEASYGIYILQSPVWICLKGATLTFFPSVEIDTSKLYFLFYCVVLVTFCVLTLKLFEAPARRIVRKWLTHGAEVAKPTAKPALP
jgi:peptidoglycan/LPS O-acetylase OafA/YrhL